MDNMTIGQIFDTLIGTTAGFTAAKVANSICSNYIKRGNLIIGVGKLAINVVVFNVVGSTTMRTSRSIRDIVRSKTHINEGV